jgi:formylglycine-generating enzyme required for sulfatase activity
MKTKSLVIRSLGLLALLAGVSCAHPAAVQIGITAAAQNAVLSWPATATNYILQSATNLAPASWQTVSNAVPALVNNYFTVTITNTARARFFRLYNTNSTPTVPVPWGMVLIPAGSFTMGDTFNEGNDDELPLHTVYVSAFYMDQYDVTYAFWQQVCGWATNHGYNFDEAGSGKGGGSAGADHPVQTIDWYDSVKWCNARSEMEGRTPSYYTDGTQTVVYRTGEIDLAANCVNWGAGYRLPTEAEWEKAARGGASGQRFPWGNTISWSQANYYGDPLLLDPNGYAYDLATTVDYDPAFSWGDWTKAMPYTSPVDNFAPNEYGLYDMAGNVWQWCWDWYGDYSSDSQTDPRGPTAGQYGAYRVYRGGSWKNYAFSCTAAARNRNYPGVNGVIDGYVGFRCVLPPGQ